MRKEIYLIKGISNETYQQFSDRILSFTSSLANEKETIQAKVTYTLNPPPKISVIPFKKEKIAAISVYTLKGINRNIIITETGFYGGYEVEEALPVEESELHT